MACVTRPNTSLAASMAQNVLPLIVPALSDGADVDMVLDRVDGVLNQRIAHQCSSLQLRRGRGPRAMARFDPARDRLSMALIRRAIERGVPRCLRSVVAYRN